MSWFAVGSAAATVVGGAISANQANKGAKAQANSAQAAIDEQRAAREQARGDLMPYQQLGQGAIPLLQQLNSGDYSGFLESPDYLAARDLGQSQIDRGAASRGGLFGGGHTRDTVQFGGQLASQYLGNYRNSLMSQLGAGQNAAAGMGGFSANAANQIGQGLGAQGDARASGYNNNAQFAAGTAGALNGLFQQYGAQRSPSYAAQPTYTGLGGQSTLSQQQPTFGNNYANFGNFDWRA